MNNSILNDRRRRSQTNTSDLPIVKVYRRLLVANSAVRRDAKSLLYDEIALALEAGVPLDKALLLASKASVDDEIFPRQGERAIGERLFAGAWKLTKFFLTILFVVLVIIFPVFVLPVSILFLLLIPMAPDEAGVARRLAHRLFRHVNAGLPLATAMRAHPLDFHPEERTIVEAAEVHGGLAEAFRNLARMHRHHLGGALHGSPAGYAAILAVPTVGLFGFIMSKAIPKYQDIFQQLGAELPLITQLVIDLDYVGVLSWFIVPGMMVILFFLARHLMTGGRFAKTLLIIPLYLAFALIFGFVARFIDFSDLWFQLTAGRPGAATQWGAILVIAAVIAFLLIPLTMPIAERLVLAIERGFERSLASVPFAGRVFHLQDQARFLTLIRSQLVHGVPPHEAVLTAGRSVCWRTGLRAARAASLIEGGHRISDSLLKSRSVDRRHAERLAFHEESATFLDGLSLVAEEANSEAREASMRFSSVSQIAVVFIVAAFVMLVLLAIYLPLFSIPSIVGKSGGAY